MSNLLAERFKNRRTALKMSQAELAKGLCKQGQISRIEQGNYSPGAELLYNLSKRLNVSLDYFFDETIEEKSKNLEQFKEVSKRFLTERNYESLKYIYDLEIIKKNKLSISDQLYLSWIDAVLTFNYEKEQNQAIKKLEKLISQMKETDPMYLTVSMGLLNFYFEKNDNESYEKFYKEISERVSKVTINTLEDIKLVIKFKYNYSHHLWKCKEIEKAILETTDTIELCKKYETKYLLADLYCLLGNISEGILEKEIVKNYFKTSQVLYSLAENSKMMIVLENYIKENF